FASRIARRYPSRLSFYVAFPESSIQRLGFPSMSRTPGGSIRSLLKAKEKYEGKLRITKPRLNAWSVVVIDRKRRQCRGLSRGAGLRPHHAAAGWTEIFPAARARGVTIPGFPRCCTE